MTLQNDVALRELEFPQDLFQIFRSFGVPINEQRAKVLDSMDSYKLSLHPSQQSQLALRRLSALESLFSPIRRLPSEILVEIFRLYQVPHLTSSRLHSHTRDSSPLILCSVCTVWRTTVLSHPVLWARMDIAARGDHYSGIEVLTRHLEGIRSWMDRIGGHSWSLCIDVKSVSEPRSAHAPLSGILRHPATAQLRKLRLDADESITGVEELIFPSLESLVIRWRQANSPVQTVEPAFPVVPSMKKLVIVNVISLNTFTDKLSWSGLTHIFIQGITIQKWRMIISQCTSLKEACFLLLEPSDHVDEHMPGNDQMSPTILPHLTQLTFLDRLPLHYGIQQLFFPVIEELNILLGELTNLDWNSPALHTAFHSVTRLTIAGRQRVTNLPSTIFRLLEATPAVERLHLDIDCNLETLLRFLIYDPGKPRLISLQRLDIFCDAHSPQVLGHDGSERTSVIPILSLSPIGEVEGVVRSRAGVLSHGLGSEKSLKEVTFRFPMPQGTSGSHSRIADAVRTLSVRYGIRIIVIQDGRSIASPFLSPTPGDPSGGYKHWDDGLMDFLARD